MAGDKSKTGKKISLECGINSCGRKYIIEQLKSSSKLDFGSLEEKAKHLGCEERFTHFHAIRFHKLKVFIPEKERRVKKDFLDW